MKTKWQVWAHLLCTNYSISALKKITKWLRSKDIIELEWIDVINHFPYGAPHDMTYFMAWYKDDSPTCATYPRLSEQIKTRYSESLRIFNSKIANEIHILYDRGDLDVSFPF